MTAQTPFFSVSGGERFDETRQGFLEFAQHIVVTLRERNRPSL